MKRLVREKLVSRVFEVADFETNVERNALKLKMSLLESYVIQEIFCLSWLINQI